MKVQQASIATEGPRAIGGLFFPLFLVGAVGLLVLALADHLARDSSPEAEPLFWIGLLFAFVPLAVRAVGPATSRRERIACLCGLVLLLSLVKPLAQPDQLTFFDELAHWRSLIDILRTGHLFTPNPLLSISPSYPGLESATAALIGATGLPAPAAAAIVIAAARLVLVLGLFLFFELLTGTPRMGAAAAVVFMANPRFLFFDDQFAYESMALGLAALILFLEARRARDDDAAPLGAWALIALAVLALVVTHHVTSYALLGFVAAWALAARLLHKRGPVALAALLAGVELLWFALAGRPTLEYLQGGLQPALEQAGALLHGGGRHLFQASNGQVADAWRQVLGLASALLVVVALPLGMLRVWHTRRLQAPYLVLMLTAAAYPLSLGLHLLPDGAEIANRMAEFVFVGVGAVLALVIDAIWPIGWVRRRVVTAWLSVVFSGGVIVGWPPQMTLPDPYLVGADSRSVDALGVAAASWSRERLGPGQRFAADRTNRSLLGTYGGQEPVTDYGSHVVTAQLFLSPEFDDADLAILRQGRVRYLLVDRRLSTALPLVGVYFEDGEPPVQPAGQPIPAAWLDKFDAVPGASRVYDSGDIRIYDLGALLG
jgi:hypothetical protein